MHHSRHGHRLGFCSHGACLVVREGGKDKEKVDKKIPDLTGGPRISALKGSGVEVW